MDINLDGHTLTEGYFEGRVVDLAPTDAPYASSLAIDYISTNFVRCSLTGDVTVAPPMNPTDGARLELWLNASGGDRNLSFDSAIVIPSESTFTNPKTLARGQSQLFFRRINCSPKPTILFS